MPIQEIFHLISHQICAEVIRNHICIISANMKVIVFIEIMLVCVFPHCLNFFHIFVYDSGPGKLISTAPRLGSVTLEAARNPSHCDAQVSTTACKFVACVPSYVYTIQRILGLLCSGGVCCNSSLLALKMMPL